MISRWTDSLPAPRAGAREAPPSSGRAPGGGSEKKSGGKAAEETPSFREIYAENRASRAVDRALEFLRARQESDGSWMSGIGKSTGVVSLAVMAFLARGHVPGRGKYGDTLDRAIAWVVQQAKDGLILRDTSHGPMYCHAISTLMLGEVLGMVNEEREGFRNLAKVHQSAVDTLLRAQNVNKDPISAGGWRYNVNSTDSDVSVTGWALLALRSGREIGLLVPRRNIDQALAYIRRCAGADGGFGYQPGGDPNLGRTGTGVLALQICGDFNSPEALRGGDYVRRVPLRWTGPFLYYAIYYCSQGMYQLGGDYWKDWRKRAEAMLLAHQNPDGGWTAPPNSSHEHQAGTAYMTSMAILALCVEFKYLPIYQR